MTQELIDNLNGKKNTTNKLPSFDRMVANVLSVYNARSAQTAQGGSNWYGRASAITREIAFEFGVCPEVVAYITAVTSVNSKWYWTIDGKGGNLRNVFNVLLFTHTPINNCPKIATYGAMQRKAIKIANMARNGQNWKKLFDKSPKHKSFASLIYNPLCGDVCIDGHAYNIAIFGYDETRATLRKCPAVTGKRYEIMQAVYRQAAKIANIEPHVMQAITWETWRNIPTR